MWLGSECTSIGLNNLISFLLAGCRMYTCIKLTRNGIERDPYPPASPLLPLQQGVMQFDDRNGVFRPDVGPASNQPGADISLA